MIFLDFVEVDSQILKPAKHLQGKTKSPILKKIQFVKLMKKKI